MKWLQKIAWNRPGEWVTWRGNPTLDAHYVHMAPKARFEYPELSEEHTGLTICGLDIPGRGAFPASGMTNRCQRCQAELSRRERGWPND